MWKCQVFCQTEAAARTCGSPIGRLFLPEKTCKRPTCRILRRRTSTIISLFHFSIATSRCFMGGHLPMLKFRASRSVLLQHILNPILMLVQAAQANEILQGPANTTLPVVLVCDCNSNANGTGTYGNLITAGFEDAWNQTNPDGSGIYLLSGWKSAQ